MNHNENVPAPVPVRSIFATKTAACSYLVAMLGVWPDGSAWVSAHAQLVLLGLAAVQLLLRRITHGRVVLVADSVNGL